MSLLHLDIPRYQQYVGPVSYLSLDGVTIQGCKRLRVASERGVVAAIHAETGDIGVCVCVCVCACSCACVRGLLKYIHVQNAP